MKTSTLLLAFTAIILMQGVNGCALKGPFRCYLGMFHGRIVDVDTGEPIEGAVIHVTYRAYGASAAGAIGTEVAVRETLSNADGEYVIPAETIEHECFRGQLSGDIQFFKPGYGVIGHKRLQLSCPDREKEKVFSHYEEPVCVTVSGKYLIWGLPKLKTKEERIDNLRSVHRARRIPVDNQKLLIQSIKQEEKFLGL